MRKLSSALLALLFGVTGAPAPVVAQTPADAQRIVYRCDYNGEKRDGRSLVILGRHYVVTGGADAGKMADDWYAWLKSKGLVTGGRYWAHCSGSPEDALDYVQALTAKWNDWLREEVDWRPDYGEAYELPSQVYYYCASGERKAQRGWITSLFRAPMPPNLRGYMEDLKSKHLNWLYAQSQKSYLDDYGCTVLTGEAYQTYARVAGQPYGADKHRMLHSEWKSGDEVLTPNLVDDPVAREKFAKLRMGSATRSPGPAAPRLPPPKPEPARTSAGGSLTIERDTSAADVRRAWDAQVAKALKQEAEQKAVSLTKSAQADAKLKAEAEKARQERLERGRAQ